MSPITLLMILISMGHFALSDSLNDSKLKRKPCKTTADCGSPNKECVEGQCFCKPEFDDVLVDSDWQEGSCMRSHGVSCSKQNKDMLCNVYKNLKCDKYRAVCVCHKHDDDHKKPKSPLIYDKSLGKCAAPPGETCDLTEHDWSPIKIGCVPNAQCVPDEARTENKFFYGVCECIKGYTKSSDRKSCIPGVGGKCQVDGDCTGMDGGGTVCLDGKCSCAVDRLHDEKSNKCRLKIGHDCEAEQDNCMDGTHCTFKSGNDPTSKYKWGWECTCNDDRVFDEKRGHCSVKVGGECDDVTVNRCVIHAFCGTGSKCQCFEGYKTTEAGTCLRRLKEGEEMSEEILQKYNDTNTKINTVEVKPEISGSGPLIQFIRSGASSTHYCVIITSISFLARAAFVLSLGFHFHNVI